MNSERHGLAGRLRARASLTHRAIQTNDALHVQDPPLTSPGDTAASVEPGQTQEVVGTSRVTVVIVSFNTRDHLRACLDSVLAEGPGGVVVVDNASTDGTTDMVRLEYPGVALHANSTNLGYGSAANQAIAGSRGDYVLLLNCDTLLLPGTIAKLASHMDRHPEAGVVGPLLRHPDGSVDRSYFALPGTLSWLLENEPVVWLLRCLPVGRQRFLCLTAPTVDRVVPWVKGAALLLRRTAFEAVGGFDESYFMYFEEVDLCLRLHAIKKQVHFTPTATVIHIGGVSTSHRRTEMLVAHFRSSMRFYRRHYSAPRRLFWVVLIKLKMLVRLVRDSALLVVAPDEHARTLLLQQVAAWKTSLW